MKKFLISIFTAVMVIASLGSYAQTTLYRSESERLGYDSKTSVGTNSWAAERRWSNGEPGIGSNFLYRAWLGYRSSGGETGTETELVIDGGRSVTVEGVTSIAPLRISHFFSDNHWNTPRNLTSAGGFKLELFTNSNPNNTALGFNLVGLENKLGTGGGFITSTYAKDSQYIDFNMLCDFNFTASGSIKRSAIRNNGSGVYTFGADFTIDANDLTLPDFTVNADKTISYSELKKSGFVFETVQGFNKYVTGGDLVVNSTVLADNITVEFRKSMTQLGKMASLTSAVGSLAQPQIIVGGAGTNTFNGASIYTDVVFAKTGGALAISGDNPSIVIQNAGSLKYAASDQVPANTSLTFKNPIAKPIYAANGTTNGESCDNIAGTLYLNSYSQSFGALTISRLGAAPTIAVVDFGDNDANQTLSFDSFAVAAKIKGQPNQLIFKNYKMGADHIYIKEKPASDDEACIYITELTTGKTSVAGAQNAGELGWEYMPDILPLASTPTNVAAGMTVTLSVDTTLAPITWYVSKDGGTTYTAISGASAKSYSFVAGDAENQDNYIYKCTAGTGDTLKDSGQYKLTILEPVAITQQPVAPATNDGQTVTISIGASGSKLTYQWYYSTNGTDWIKIDGADKESYTFNASLSQDGTLFRCEVSNPLSGAAVVSNSTALVVGTPAVIITSPTECMVISGAEPAKFSCLVESGTSVGAMWQVSTNAGASWADVSSGSYEDTEDGRLYTFETTLAANTDTRDGRTMYRCAAINKANARTFSSSATLYAYYTFTYIVQPVDCTTSLDGAFTFGVKFICYKDTPTTGKFTISASSGSTTYTASIDVTNVDENKNYTNEITITSPVSLLSTNGTSPLLFNGASGSFTLSQKAVYDSNNNVVHAGVTNKASKSAVLYIYTKPQIVKQPANVYISENPNGTLPDATFSIEAVGVAPITYQWQRALATAPATFVNITGATDTTYTETYYKASGNLFRCVVKNVNGTTTSNAAKIIVNPPINIDENNPADANIGLYGSTQMRAIASATTGRLTYQWYISQNGDKNNMQEISGATSPTLSLNEMPFTANGYMYQCKITNFVDENDSENIMEGYTRIATLVVSPTPIIEQQPTNVSVIEGDKCTFSIKVNGGKLTYKWFVSKDGGVTWLGLSNSNSPTYKADASYDMKNWLYYCEISYPGGVITSNQVKLAVSKAVIFEKQPEKFVAYAGKDAAFNVVSKCEESGVTFKWQYSYDNVKWTDFVNSKNTSHLTENLLFTTASEHANVLFRCVATNYMGIEFYSDPAILWIKETVKITRQIDATSGVSGTIFVLNGAKSQMSISASGEPTIKYQWQKLDVNKVITYQVHTCTHVDENGSACGYVYDDTSEVVKWADLPETWICPNCGNTTKANFGVASRTTTAWEDIPNATNSSYDFTGASSMNGLMFRCIASNEGGTAISNAVTMAVREEIKLDSTSSAQYIFDGEGAVLKVDVSGGDRSYQWFTSSDDGRTWTAIDGATMPEYVITNANADKLMNNLFYCEITNDISTIKAPSILLAVFAKPQISPESIDITAGESATISLDNPSTQYQKYQWQVSSDNGATWKTVDSQTGTSLKLATTLAMNKNQYRVVSTIKESGRIAVSNVSTILVHDGIAITSQPKSVTVAAGKSASFTVEATGEVNYQWQSFDYANDTWNDITSTRFSGATTKTLTLATALKSDLNTIVRCRLSNASMSVNTSAVTLIVEDSLQIDVEPNTDVVTYEGGENITLSVSASGTDVKYQWQKYNSQTGTWQNVSGATSSTCQLNADSDTTGDYRCVVSNAGMSVISGVSHVTVYAPSSIIASTPIGYVGGAMTLSVVPMDGATYQWQESLDGKVWANISGNSNSLQFNNMVKTQSGMSLRCVTTTNAGIVVSESFVLEVIEPIVITENITDVSVAGGSDLTLEVKCSSDASEATSYQWQTFRYEADGWEDIADATSPVLALTEQRSENSGIVYRCKIFNRAQTLYSNTAKVLIGESYKVLPEVALVAIDPATKRGKATFAVENNSTMAIQWQVSTNNGATWSNIAGANFNTLNLDVDASFNAYQYRAVLTGTAVTVKSLVGSILIDTDIKIISQPNSKAVDSGIATRFAVGVSGVATYQWQRQNNASSTWSNISGATGYEYLITPTISDNGAKFRCAVTSANNAVVINSLPASLTVKQPMNIVIKELEAVDYNINTTSGSNVTLAVELTSPTSLTGVAFDWQISNDTGRSWSSVASGNGAQSIKLEGVRTGALYRCNVSNGATSSALSKIYNVNVFDSFKIIKVDTSKVVSTSESTSFTCEVAAAHGASIVYAWQIGSVVKQMPATTSTVSTLDFTSDDLKKYGNCKIYFGARYADKQTFVWSSAMTLTVTDTMMYSQQGSALTFSSIYEDVAQVQIPATFTNTIAGPSTLTYTWNEKKIRIDPLTNLPTRDNNKNFEFESSVAVAKETSKQYIMLAVTPEDSVKVISGTAWIGSYGLIAFDLPLILTDPIVITKQPTAESLGLYASTTLSASATTPAISDDYTKTVFTYYTAGLKAVMPTAPIVLPRYSVWQVSYDNGATWNDMKAFTGDNLELKEVTPSMNGYQYRVKYYNRYVNSKIFTDYTWNLVYSDIVTLSVSDLPLILSNPSSLKLLEGATANFSIEYSAGNATLQWQQSIDNGATWSDISGATSTSYSTATNFGMDGNLYRCFVVNEGGAVISTVAKLSVGSEVSVQKNPEIQEVVSGGVAQFSVNASSAGAIKYQWQISFDLGATWNDYDGLNASGKTDTLSVAVDDSLQNAVFRCNFASVAADGSEISAGASAGAILHVLPKSEIVDYPKTVSVALGDNANLYVKATGLSLTYQWQKFDGASGYVNIAGATSSTYLVASVSNDMDGAKYRCMVSDMSQPIGFAEITLKVSSAVVAENVPTQVSGYVGQKLVLAFDVKNSAGANYVWQYFDYSKDTWVNVTAGSRYTIAGASLTINSATMDDLNSIFRCVVSNDVSSVTTSGMLVVVYPTPTVSAPTSVKTVVGGSANLYVEATGTKLAYQWQKLDKTSGAYVNIAAATQSSYLVSNVTADMDGDTYKCVVSDMGVEFGSAITKIVLANTLSVVAPESASAYAGGTITVELEVVGDSPDTTYAWQRFDYARDAWVGVSYTVNRNVLTITDANESHNNMLLRCVIDNGGMSVTSSNIKTVIYKNPTIDAYADVSAVVDGSAIFTVTATGNDLSYQWQKLNTSTSSYDDIAGQTKSTYTIAKVSKDINGAKFRCVVSDMGKPFGNADMTLYVVDKITVEEVPTQVSVYEDGSAVLSFKVNNATAATTFVWQMFDYTANAWVNLTDAQKYVADKNSLTILNASFEDDINTRYRCVVSNGAMSVTTGSIGLLVYAKAKITQIAQGAESVNVGQTAFFSATVTGENPLSFRWYVKPANSKSWYLINGATTSTYSLADVDYSQNGNQYACVVSNAGTPFVEPTVEADNVKIATLVVLWAPEVKTQIASQEVYEGEDATFFFEVEGQPTISYQWFEYRDGVEYEMAGKTSTTLIVAGAKIADNNVGYYCRASNDAGELFSAYGKLTVKVKAVAPALVKAGETVKLKAQSLETASYQWQVKEPAAAAQASAFALRASSMAVSAENDGWKNIEGETSQTLQLTSLYSLMSNAYRCVVTVADEQVESLISSATTDEIKLSVGETYSTWATTQGLDSESAYNIAMPSTSITNIEKYVFALNSAAISTLNAGITLEKTATGTTLVKYPVAIYVTDAIVGVQYSTDMTNWKNLDCVPTLVETTQTARIYQVEVPESKQVFVRFTFAK